MTAGYETSGKLTISEIILAVPQGTVLFSTITAPILAFIAIVLVADSRAQRSALAPAPTPYALVGVLTQIKIMSALAMQGVTLVEKKRLGPRAGRRTPPDDSSTPGSPDMVASLVPSRAMRTIFGRPVSWMGRWFAFQAAMRSTLRSTTLTVMAGL
jgi:hypothetical protein